MKFLEKLGSQAERWWDLLFLGPTVDAADCEVLLKPIDLQQGREF